MADRLWDGTTYGTPRMLRWLTKLLGVLDVRVLYVFSDIFVVPVCLVKNPSGRIAFRFYRERFGYSRIRAFRAAYMNHCRFSQVVLDRFATYAGQKFSISVEGYGNYLALAERDEAFMQLSAHVGNYEMAGYNLKSEKTLNTVVFGGEKAYVMENRSGIFGHQNVRMIEVSDDFSHLLKISSAIADKEIISMPADRRVGDSKTVSCNFFGEKAAFPAGPFTVAAANGLDVIAVNVMKEKGKSYKILVTPLEYDKEAGRKTRIQSLADAYAAELERVVRLYPTQWYNFYDFWKQ